MLEIHDNRNIQPHYMFFLLAVASDGSEDSWLKGQRSNFVTERSKLQYENCQDEIQTENTAVTAWTKRPTESEKSHETKSEVDGEEEIFRFSDFQICFLMMFHFVETFSALWLS